MPFEKVKNIVVAETSKEGIALDEKAKLEVSNIKTKLDQYKKKTENYIDSLSYPGKEDDKKQYVDDLRESLGEILKDNNATQQEMALYSRNVNERSEKLKKKLETEMAKIELKQVEQWMSSHFGEKFDISDNITTYFSVPEGQRIPLAKIKKEMIALLSAATSNMPSYEYRENKSSFYAILNHYCWGNAEAAKKETALVREKIKFSIKCRNIEKRTGITMGHDDFEILMTGLIKSGLANKDNVHSVLEKNINQLKNLNKGDFKRLAENVRGEAFANLLFAAIISLNKKGNAETIGGIKMIMAIESRVAENAKAINKTLADNQRKLGNATRGLKKLGSDVVIDEDIAGFKKEIAEAICGIEECKRDLLLNSAKKSLANRYLAQESSNPANKNVQNIVNLILNAKETDELNNLSLDKCNIGNIPEQALLRAAQLRIDLSVNDVAVKIWFLENQNIDGVPLHDVLNRFYETGKVTERSKGAFEAKLKIEGANLGEIIKENVEHEKAFAKTFKEIVEKYGSIEKVPEEELSSVAGQLSAYADFLKTMQKANEKYTANREESFAIFGSESALLKSEIETGKTRNEYILRQICSVSKFMKIEENLKGVLEQNEKAEKDFDKYFKDIESKYGSIDKIPAEEREKVVKKLNEYIEALKTSCLTRISYISRKEDTLGTLPPGDSYATILKMEIWGESEKIRSAEHKIGEVSKFLGMRVEKGESENPDKLESPLFAPIIQNEINPYMKSINSYGEKIQIAAQPLSGTPSLIERNIQSATWQNSKAGLAAFQEGINHTIDFARLLEEARANMENIKNQILSSIKDPAKIKGMPESMRLQREQYLRSVVENIDAELKKRYHASPLSKDSISQIKEYTNHLASQKKKYLLGTFVKGVIFTVSIASAVAGGWALGGLARTVFGLAPKVGTKFTSLAIGSKVSNFAIGAFSMSGVSLGSVVGSRLAMESLDTFGIADFGGHEAIWASGKRDEFVYGFGISLGAVLVARGIIGGLQIGSTSKTLAENLPKLSKLSQWGLKGMKGLATFANPSEWFKSKQGGLLKSFVAETGEESAQEGMESAAGKIGGRWAEFGASVLSASGGRKIDLQVHGINPSDINVDFKGNAMVYNGPNVQQFVSNLESNLAGRRNLLYKTTINPNGVVTLEIGKFHIDKKTGRPRQTTFKKFNIYPGQEAEIAGIEGLEKVKGKESVYTINTPADAFTALANFVNRGFIVVKNESGGYKISKGNFIINISLDSRIQALIDKVPLTKLGDAKFVSQFLGEQPFGNNDILPLANQLKDFYSENAQEISLDTIDNLHSHGVQSPASFILNILQTKCKKFIKKGSIHVNTIGKIHYDLTPEGESFLDRKRKKYGSDIMGGRAVTLVDIMMLEKNIKMPTSTIVYHGSETSSLHSILEHGLDASKGKTINEGIMFTGKGIAVTGDINFAKSFSKGSSEKMHTLPIIYRFHLEKPDQINKIQLHPRIPPEKIEYSLDGGITWLKKSQYTINNEADGTKILTNFYKQGFKIFKIDDTTLKVSKNNISIEIKVSKSYIFENRTKGDFILRRKVKNSDFREMSNENDSLQKLYNERYKKLGFMAGDKVKIDKSNDIWHIALEISPSLVRLSKNGEFKDVTKAQLVLNNPEGKFITKQEKINSEFERLGFIFGQEIQLPGANGKLEPGWFIHHEWDNDKYAVHNKKQGESIPVLKSDIIKYNPNGPIQDSSSSVDLVA